MIKIAIVEDEAMYAKQLEEFLHQYEAENHEAFDITIYSDGDQIVNKYKSQFDIILMDVEMKFMDGMSAAEEIRKMDSEVVIIFITNFIQHAPEGFEVQAFRYLLKADLSAKLDSYFDSAVQEVLRRKQLVTISINSEIIDVPVNDILYLESHRRIIVMHLLDEKRPAYQFYGNITELSEKIEPLGFLRIQKSYLVNMHYVEIFQYNKVQLRGGLCLAPSEKNYSELKQKYLHWRGKSRWML